jgi:hypothetical protein
MDANYALVQAMFFALAGWIATCHRLVNSQVKPQTRRLLVVPLWFAWMALALGGPVFQGIITAQDALSIGVSFSFGMLMFMVFRGLNARKSR